MARQAGRQRGTRAPGWGLAVAAWTLAWTGMAGAARGQALEGVLPMDPKTVTALTKTLGLTPEQTQAAQELVKGAMAEHEKGEKDFYAAINAMDEAGAWADRTARRAKIETMEASFVERDNALGQSLVKDLRSLLTSEQATQWPAVERQLRRRAIASWYTLHTPDEHWMYIDIPALLADIHASDEEMEALKPTLDVYEKELDSAILAMDPIYKAYKQRQTEMRDAAEAGDMAKVHAIWDPYQDARMRLDALCRSAAKSVESRLGEVSAKAFHDKAHALAYDGLYERRARRLPEVRIAAAELLDNLDDAQREALAAIKLKYEQECAELNRWAESGLEQVFGDPAVLLECDTKGRSGTSAAWWHGFHQRRTAMEEWTMATLEAMLTPEQRDRLPDLEPPLPKEMR